MLHRQASVLSNFHHRSDISIAKEEEEDEDEEEEGIEEDEEDGSVCARLRPRKKILFQGRPKYGPPPGLSLNTLRPLKSVHAIEIVELLTEKMEQCCVNYDFLHLSKSTIDGLAKTSTLVELVDWLQENDAPCDALLYSTAMTMAQINLARYFPRTESIDCYYCIDVEMYEASWPHLSRVYDILLLLFNSTEFKENVVMNCLTQKFVSELVSLFDSLDYRERDRVKKLIHRIYVKLQGLRQLIRLEMYYVLLTFIHETDHFNGVAEILEILGSIIPGYETPLQIEHLILFYKILLPLHKARCLHGFHGQLMYCMVQFIEKDQSLFHEVLAMLFKHWPHQCVPKQVMFLSEVDELINVIQPEVFEMAFDAIFRLLDLSLASEHYQVVERALHLLNNERIDDFLSANHLIVYVFPHLYYLMTRHWSRSVKTLTYHILAKYKNLDEEYFDDMTYYVASGGRLRPKPVQALPQEEEGELRGEFAQDEVVKEYATDEHPFENTTDVPNEENEI